MAVALRDYGAILIADPTLSEDGLSQLKSQFGEMVGRQGGKVLEVASLGRKRMAFRIGKHSEGNYLQIKMQMPPAGVDGLTKMTRAVDQVVRLMVVSAETIADQPAAPKPDEKTEKVS